MSVQSFLDERKYEMNGKTWFVSQCRYCDYAEHDFLRQRYQCSLMECDVGKGEEIPDDCLLERKYAV